MRGGKEKKGPTEKDLSREVYERSRADWGGEPAAAIDKRRCSPRKTSRFLFSSSLALMPAPPREYAR